MENTKRKKLKPKKTFWVLLVLLVLIAVAVVFFLLQGKPKNTVEATPTPEPTETPITMDMGPSYDVDFAALHEANPEAIGRIVFDSGLVDQIVCQTEDNEKYLNTSWDLQPDIVGSAFLDYRNTMVDQNLIIYGHFVYADESLMFSPLHQLEDPANYEANEFFDLILEDEIRRYQVAYVWQYEMDNNLLQYFQTNYYEDYFEPFLEAVQEASFYETGETLTYDDHWVTLQTCVRGRDDLRLIVMGKQIAIVPNE